MYFDTITINQPNSISSSYTITNYNGYNVSCNGVNDHIDLQWTGGTSPYQEIGLMDLQQQILHKVTCLCRNTY